MSYFFVRVSSHSWKDSIRNNFQQKLKGKLTCNNWFYVLPLLWG